jgi:hypothetical protein
MYTTVLARTRSGVRPLGVFAALALVVGASLPSATAASPAHVYPEAHPVLAYYYGMHSNDVERQIKQAQSAGIDGFIVWWDGDGTDRDKQLGQILQAGRASGFRATMHFHAWDTNLAGELQGFYDKRLNDPGLVSYQGRPVLFFWATWLHSAAEWNDLRATVDPQRRAMWLADGDKFNLIGEDAWDGISPYAIAWSGNPRGQLPSWAAKSRAVAADKLWVPPVSPGCDDSIVRAVTCFQDRADGAYYRATWAGALASNPPWAIVVSTWDEWSEQTAIEPNSDWGDQYLQITREYADSFHGQAPTDMPPPDDASGG